MLTALHGVAGLPGDWRIRDTSFTGALTSVATAPGQLIAVGQGGAILRSDNGIDWIRVPHAVTGGSFYCVTFAKGLYVAGGNLGCLMAISPDGVNWTNIQSTGSIHAHFGVTYGAGRFVAVGLGTGPIPNCRLITSTNGIDWETAVRPTTNTLRSVTFANGKYVAVGDRGTIVTSQDAITWTVQISGTEHPLRSVIFTGREFLAGGDSSTLLTSGDGISWVTVPFSSFDITEMAACGTAVVAVGGLGGEGRVQASADGLSWPGSASMLPSQLNSIVQYDVGRFIAVGNNGLIIDSAHWADPPRNIWTKTTNGYWHESHWSLGHMPSWKDHSIIFTNGGGKTLEIDATTTRDYTDSMLINELVLNAPEGSQNTLFLNNAGLGVPLLINSLLRVPPNTSVLNVNSALEAPSLELSAVLTLQENAQFLFRNIVNVGVQSTGTVNQSSGAFSAEWINLGFNFPGTWDQSDGNVEADVLAINGDSTYNFLRGLLKVNLDLHLAPRLGKGTPRLSITNGSVIVNRLLNLEGGEITLAGRTLTTSNTTVGPAARFIQEGGEHRVQNELTVQGIYEARSGGVLFKRIRLQGTLEFNGGWNSNAELAFDGGILKGYYGHFFNHLTLTSSGTIDFQQRPTIFRFESVGPWAGTLFLTNWTAGMDQLFMGRNATSLSADKLSQIQFINPGGFAPGIYNARITSSGEVVPVIRLDYQSGGNSLVLRWPQGFRLLSATNVAGPYSLMTNAISPYTAYHTDPQRYFILANEN